MLQKEMMHVVPRIHLRFLDTEDKGDFYPGQFCAEAAAEISFNFTGAAEAIIDITNKAYQTTLL